jgi:hypothetical protein
VVKGFLLSVPLQVEGFCQIQRRFLQRQPVNGGPQVQNVALDGTVGLDLNQANPVSAICKLF